MKLLNRAEELAYRCGMKVHRRAVGSYDTFEGVDVKMRSDPFNRLSDTLRGFGNFSLYKDEGYIVRYARW